MNQGLKLGSLLRHNTYRIEKVLGQGGFGITYLATDLNLDRQVAVKEFFPKDYCDRDDTTSKVTLGTQSSKDFVNKLKAKFLKEARNIAKFDYPNIIRIHAAFEENNTAYYVMDYIEGITLSEMVKQNGPISEEKALMYIDKIGKALEYVHANTMNHLDVKPANIMIRYNDDEPILIDFGLSKQYDSKGYQTSTTPIGISHGFAPMEQYNDGGVKEFSPQTDLYSLAATLYYILSGVVPPQATKLVEDELTFPQGIPTNLIKPISKAMSPGRKRRHESVRAFLEDLERQKIERGNEQPNNQDHVSAEQSFCTENLGKSNNLEQEQTHTQTIIHDNDEYEEKSKSWIKWLGIGGGVAVIAVIIVFLIPSNNNTDNSNESDNLVESIKEEPKTVKDLFWESPLGMAAYTGEVTVDTINDKQVPHGKGIARIIKGKFEGSTYNGAFVEGKMEGETTYTMKNGDTFVGTYKNNKYDKGRYTIKANGEYFEGTFKNGQPDKGNWYDKKGNKL
ncbi:MAG: protein kinase [Bacteroides sp.]|nr:protein kinase [Bacteroides sp.]